MEMFDLNTLSTPTFSPGAACTPDLTEALTVAHISQGMDPLQAVLEAQLQAPLIEPLLF